MRSHCPLPHLDQVVYSTLLPQSDLLSDPDPQTFSQPVAYPIWEVPTHKSLGHTEETTLPTTFPACLSWKACICPLHHPSPTTSYFIQQYSSCATICDILVLPACFPGCSHLYMYPWGRPYSTLFLRSLLFLLSWIFGVLVFYFFLCPPFPHLSMACNLSIFFFQV